MYGNYAREIHIVMIRYTYAYARLFQMNPAPCIHVPICACIPATCMRVHAHAQKPSQLVTMHSWSALKKHIIVELSYCPCHITTSP